MMQIADTNTMVAADTDNVLDLVVMALETSSESWSAPLAMVVVFNISRDNGRISNLTSFT
jgi:hypothetical protein